MTLKQQIQAKIGEGMTIGEAVEEVLPGADVKFWTKVLNTPDSQPKRKSSRTPSRHCSKRVNYAERVVSSVTLQADERALAVARRMDELKA